MISRDFMDFRGPGLVLAAISSIFKDFYDFHKFSKDFMDFRGRGFAACGALSGRGRAPLETFTRSQLAAISLIFMDFHDFQRFSEDFMRFEGLGRFS